MEKELETPGDILKHFFNKATKTDAGQELIKKYNFTFQFNVTDGEDFYLDIKDGNYSIKKGKTPEKDVDKKTLVEGSNDSLTQIFKGEFILWDAVWDRKLKAECYGPSQAYVSWLSQFFKIGRHEKLISEFFNN